MKYIFVKLDHKIAFGWKSVQCNSLMEENLVGLVTTEVKQEPEPGPGLASSQHPPPVQVSLFCTARFT